MSLRAFMSSVGSSKVLNLRVSGTTPSWQLVSEVKVVLGTVPSNSIFDLHSSQCVNLHACVCVEKCIIGNSLHSSGT